MYAVVLNMMQQLAALYTPTGRNAVGLDVRNVHFAVCLPTEIARPPVPSLRAHSAFSFLRAMLQPVFEKLADLLGVLITLDEIIRYNENLLQHWQLYRRCVNSRYGRGAVREQGLTPVSFAPFLCICAFR